MFTYYTRKYCIVALSLFLLVSCAQEGVKLRFSKPAEIGITGVKRVAVANFEIEEIRRVTHLERNGEWNRHSAEIPNALKTAIAKQIRGKVINLLSSSPSFEIVYSDEVAQLADDEAIRNMVASAGFKAQKIDAFINGKVWINVDNYDGVDLAKLALTYVLENGEGSPAYTADALLYWPYKSIKGTLALEIKMTRAQPTEVLAVAFEKRSFGNKIGGQPPNILEQIKAAADEVKDLVSEKEDDGALEESALVLPNFTQVISDTAESIAAKFSKKIAISEKEVSINIASGGDLTSVQLIQAGAFNSAIHKLNQVAEKNNPSDKYNLGLCYEAIGDYGLASVAYEEALTAENGNLTFAEGVGRIERLKREYRQVRIQLSSKN